MSLLRRIVKTLVPSRVRDSLRQAHRDFVFRRAMKRFLKSPADCAHAGNPILRDLIFGWGNDTWSALDEYLVGCIERALTTPGPILECGSGLSTILLGAIARTRGTRHWALEHMPEWAARVQSYLNRYKIDSVVLCPSPLKDHGEFSWYDPPLASMPVSFALVLCDGPPSSTTRGGRYGLVPIMKPRLKPGCVILLDDAGREQERAIADRWQAELGATLKLIGTDKPYIELTVTKN